MNKMKQVIEHLDAIAEILGENVPIVFLPLGKRDGVADPFKGSPAFIVRQPEHMAELNRMYKVGDLDLDPPRRNCSLRNHNVPPHISP